MYLNECMVVGFKNFFSCNCQSFIWEINLNVVVFLRVPNEYINHRYPPPRLRRSPTIQLTCVRLIVFVWLIYIIFILMKHITYVYVGSISHYVITIPTHPSIYSTLFIFSNGMDAFIYYDFSNPHHNILLKKVRI